MCGTADQQLATSHVELLPVELLQRLTDVHCHPSDDSAGLDAATNAIESLHTSSLCAQSSTLDNLAITRSLAKVHPDRVIPFFGIHPWFVHAITPSTTISASEKERHYESIFPSIRTDSTHKALFDSLPSPTPLSTLMSRLEQDLIDHPHAHIGEIGLDKAFRIRLPLHLQPPPGQGSKNTKLQTPLSHQLVLVEAQLDLAIKFQRHVSFHSVRSSVETVQLLQRYRDEKPGFERIHVCLHSFGGSPESIRQLQKIHHNVYFSFASIISGRSPKFLDMLRAVEEHRILVESDFSDASQIDHQITEVVQAICLARSWSIERCVEQLEKNWGTFSHLDAVGSGRKKKSKKDRRLDEIAKTRRGGSEDSY